VPLANACDQIRGQRFLAFTSITNPDGPWYSLSMTLDKQSPGGRDSAGPSIAFRLEPHSGVPTYLQLVQQVERALRLGYLEEGDQLPRVKDVVSSLSINPNTVLKAYRDLEQKGLIWARPGLGTFVLESLETVDKDEITSLQEELVEGWLRNAVAGGLDEADITALFASALHESYDALSREDKRPRSRSRGRRGAA